MPFFVLFVYISPYPCFPIFLISLFFLHVSRFVFVFVFVFVLVLVSFAYLFDFFS